MKPRQDRDVAVFAAIDATVAELALSMKDGRFEGRVGQITFKEFVLRSEMGRRLEEPDKDGWQRVVFHYDDDQAKTVIEKAITGDETADTLLREVISQKLQAGEAALPPNLLQYVVSYVLTNRNRPKGGRPVNFLERDSAIHSVVDATIRRGFLLARNETTKSATESASSIVSTALAKLGVTLSEKSVTRIWRDIDEMSQHPSMRLPWRVRSGEALP
jgi:hypothetical protein